VHHLLDDCTGIAAQFPDLKAQTDADTLSNGESSAETRLISPRSISISRPTPAGRITH
jgi:hypothetical protein